MELVLVRHGRIAGHPLRPRDDSPLSTLGAEQARRTAEFLATDLPPDALVCSPLRRARETAEIIGDHLQLPPRVVADLTEMRRREFFELMRATMRARLPFARRSDAERYAHTRLMQRECSVLAQLCTQHAGQRVLVVAHGGVIWGMLSFIFPEQRRTFAKQREVANCSITRIVLTPEGPRLAALNDTTHLDDPMTR